jgi:hypothetical protein
LPTGTSGGRLDVTAVVVVDVAVGVEVVMLELELELALELALWGEPPQAASSRHEIRGAIARRQLTAPA